jgi:carbon storage regulator
MLVLSRKKNESICIGENIRIVVIDIQDGKIRLGIEAPKDIAVHRQEVFEAIKKKDGTK